MSLTEDKVRELVRQADYVRRIEDPREPPAYADKILVTRQGDTATFLVTCVHGQTVNRYVVEQSVSIRPVESFK